MTPSDSGVLRQLDELLVETGQGRVGALWNLAVDSRQLDANLIRLAPHSRVEEHLEPDLDVLLHITAGSGVLASAAGRQPLTAGAVAWLPHGTSRALEAGPSGLAYLTVHRRRQGMGIGTVATPRVRHREPEGGESACLLDRVCTDCGRLTPDRTAHYCPRCGTLLPTDD